MNATTYWDGNGRYQKESEQVDALGLIPSEGEASDPAAETLRMCRNAYYGIRIGAYNPNRFDGLARITCQSPLSAESKTVLINLFLCANRGVAKIDFDGIPSPDFNGFPSDNVFHVQHIEKPLEELMDWAILNAWTEHCRG